MSYEPLARSIRRCLPLAVVAVLAIAATAEAQERIPEHLRSRWEGAESWPLLRPGDARLDPARIVGTRAEYVFESGLHNDQRKEERRVWEVDRGTYYGHPIVVIEQIDTGHDDHGDVFSRHTSWYVERDTFSLKFVLGADPLSSTQRIIRFEPDHVVNTSVETDGGAQTILLPGEHRAFSYRMFPQLLAAMPDLRPGMTFRLVDFSFWDDAGISENDMVRVGDEVEIEDASGGRHTVNVVYWRTVGGWETEYYLGDEWPYYYGQVVRNDRIAEGRRLIYRETFVGAQRIR